MSIEEKVGQLFQVGFSGNEVNEEIRDMIENYHVGSVIYFSRNIESPEQVSRLSNNLQELAINSKTSLPLMISADQEGGTVTRLNGGSHFPGNMVLGAADSNDLANKAAKASASELKNVGINMNLAPVLDVNNNADNPVIGVRSFGEDPKKVAELGSAYFRGLQSEGVIACAKHFPGHGDTTSDSHISLPTIKHDKKRLNEVELLPFKRAIADGIDSIMTAHINFPAIEKDETVPATLSKNVLTNLLREELGYDGLIITDCMEMSAIADTHGTVEGAVRTLIAGSDTVLISHTYEKQKRAITAVINAVKSNRISEKRIDASVKRILKLKKKRIGLNGYEKADSSKINKKYSQEIAREIAEMGITMPKNKDIIPVEDIENKDLAVVDFEMGRVSLVEDNKEHDNLFVDYLAEKTSSLKHISIKDEMEFTKEDINNLSEYDIVIVCTYNAQKNNIQAEIAEKIAEKIPVVMLALRNPYDYELINNVQAFITTYDYSPANQKAAADLIRGKISAKGKLPVMNGDEH